MNTSTSPLTEIIAPLTHEQAPNPVELSATCAHRVQDYIEHNGYAHLVPDQPGEIDHTTHIEHNEHMFDIRLQAISLTSTNVFVSVTAHGNVPSTLTYMVMATTPRN